MKQNLVDPQTQHELMRWYETITKQNYFTYHKNILIQKEGLAMGAPSSGLIAEFFPTAHRTSTRGTAIKET
jgi:hypothetical protein